MTGVPEAPLDRTENGLQAAGDGWFVVNARDAVWGESETMGVFTRLGESKAARFPQLGFNIGVLWPGQPACMYHREPNQEGFLVLSGECILLVEGQQRQMKQWDYFHCPADTDHLLIASGTSPASPSRSGRGRVGMSSIRCPSSPGSTGVRSRRKPRIQKRPTRASPSRTRPTRTAGSRISSASKAWRGRAGPRGPRRLPPVAPTARDRRPPRGQPPRAAAPRPRSPRARARGRAL